MGSIYVGGSKVKKIYVGTQMVKKVYVGNTLVWSANETGYWNSTDLVKRFGGNHFYFVIYFAVLEKDYANNRMRVKYEVGMGSDDGYHISASTNRRGSGSIDGGGNNAAVSFADTSEVARHVYNHHTGQTFKFRADAGLGPLAGEITFTW